MAEQPIFKQGGVLLDHDLSEGNAISEPIDIRSSVGYSYQLTYSGLDDADATVTAEVSNDNVNFLAMNITTLNDSGGNDLVNVERSMYQFVRFNCEANTVTTGLLKITICVKRL